MPNKPIYVLIAVAGGDIDVQQFADLDDAKQQLAAIFQATLSMSTEPDIAKMAVDELRANGSATVAWYPSWKPDNGRNRPTVTAELFTDHGSACVTNTGFTFAWKIQQIYVD